MTRHTEPTIHPEALRAARNQLGLSQQDLADRCSAVGKPISKKAIYHYEKGVTQPPVKKAQWLADALGTQLAALRRAPDDEAASQARLEEYGYRSIKVVLDRQDRENYRYAAHHFGVAVQDIINAAPWMFTLLAEMSLADRRRSKEAVETAFRAAMDQMPEHLAHGMVAATPFENAIYDEEDSLAMRDLFGKEVLQTESGADPFNPDQTNPFVAFLRKTAREIGSDEIRADDLWVMPGGLPRWPVFQEWLSNLTGDDVWAEFAVRDEHVHPDKVPAKLKGAENSAARIVWLAEQIPPAIREREEKRRSDQTVEFQRMGITI